VSRIAQAALLAGLTLAGAAGAGEPRIGYMLQCQGCHLADGSGSPGAVPSLRGLVGRFLTVPGGREYLVRVPGSAQSELDDAGLAAVLNWMVREFGPEDVARDFLPFSGDEVTSYGRRPLVDVGTRRRELLRRIEGESTEPRG